MRTSPKGLRQRPLKWPLLGSTELAEVRANLEPSAWHSAERLGRSRLERGIGKLTLLVFGTLAAAAIFAGYHIIPFYYYFYEIQNQLEAVARVSDIESDKSIRTKLMYHIKKMNLPVEPGDLKIQRDGRRIQISLPYKEVFFITYKGKDYDIHTFHFHAYAEWHQ